MVTEKEARDELEDTIINWQSGKDNNSKIGECIDALLAARTEAIVDSISIFSCTCARRIESEFSSAREPARPCETDAERRWNKCPPTPRPSLDGWWANVELPDETGFHHPGRDLFIVVDRENIRALYGQPLALSNDEILEMVQLHNARLAP